MKSRLLVCVVGLVLFTSRADAVLSTNSWISTMSDFWTNTVRWSLGVAPSNNQSAVLITNVLTKTVTINATTTNQPGTLTISNLLVRGVGTGISNLQLTNMGAATPLRILNSLTVGTNAVLRVTNSVLQIVNSNGFFDISGSVSNLAGGQIVCTNSDTAIFNGGSLTSVGGLTRWRRLRPGVGGAGTMTIAGGTNIAFEIRIGDGGTGAVWITDGQLVATNGVNTVGNTSVGQMTISNGTFLANGLQLGEFAGSRGTLTMAGGTNNLSVSMAVGFVANATGSVWMTGGQLLVNNGTLEVGRSGIGQMTVSNGTVSVRELDVGHFANSSGTFTIAGGTNVLFSKLIISGDPVSIGAVWMTGGRLLATNLGAFTRIGLAGPGQMTISNGTWRARDVAVGVLNGLTGTLTILGGTNALVGPFRVGTDNLGAGTVWITGGTLVLTNNPENVTSGSGFVLDSDATLTAGAIIVSNVNTTIGNRGNATLFMGGGTLSVETLIMGAFAVNGNLTITGGTATIRGFLNVGAGGQSTGTIVIAGGRLVATNMTAAIGFNGTGQLTVSDGSLVMSNLELALGTSSHGTLAVQGGTNSIYSALVVGLGGCTSTGTVVVSGGQLFVTNAALNAVCDVQSGSLILNSGTLTIDQLVITNACGHFVRTGGALSITMTNISAGLDADSDGIPNSFDLDPFNPADADSDPDGDGFTNFQEFQAGTNPTNSASAFRITAIAREGNNLRVTWMTGTGKTNALDRSAGDLSGNFTTDFAAIFTVTNTVGTATNYLDVGAATNTPARYYRVRLVP